MYTTSFVSQVRSRIIFLLPGFVALACLSAQAKPVPSKPAEKIFFETHSAGFAIKWTDKNLAATTGDSAQPLFSAKALSQKEKPPKKAKTTEDRAFTLLSVVGPILSYQDETTLDWPGMAHPGVGDVRRFGTVDLRHLLKPAPLTDYFAAPDLYSALMTNKIIKLALKDSKAHPSNLAQLVKSVQNSMVIVDDEDAGEAKLLFTPDFLNRYSFTSASKDTANIAISLYDQEGNQIKTIDIVVPVKDPDLKKWLDAAAQKKEGILNKQLQAIAKDSETDFHFDP